MSETRLDVYLLGETQLSTSPAKLALNLTAIFKKDISVFERMLDQPRCLLKANVDTETANKYKKAIDKAGGCCELVRRSEPRLASAAVVPIAPSEAIILTAEPITAASLAIAAEDPKWAALSDSYGESEYPSADQEAATTARKKRIILVVIALIIVMSVIAAFTLPSYLDKSARAKVQAAQPLINATRQKVTAVIQLKNFLPSENLLADLPDEISNEFISSITVSEGAQLTVSFRIPYLSWNDKHTIIWTPTRNGDEVVWQCLGGTMSDKYRMTECRGGAN